MEGGSSEQNGGVLSRAPDRRWRRRSGIGDPFTRPEPNIQITTRLAKTPLSQRQISSCERVRRFSPAIFAPSSRTCFSVWRRRGRSLAAQEYGLQGRHHYEQDERADEHASYDDSRQGSLHLTADAG
jgi:hypothetical protein